MNLPDEIEAYAAYLNGYPRARDELEPEELEQYEQDMAKAEAAMYDAYYEAAQS